MPTNEIEEADETAVCVPLLERVSTHKLSEPSGGRFKFVVCVALFVASCTALFLARYGFRY